MANLILPYFNFKKYFLVNWRVLFSIRHVSFKGCLFKFASFEFEKYIFNAVSVFACYT